MNAKRLMTYYQRIADAPDAVARLRRFIMTLAVRGRLLAQNPSDEPATALLLRSKATRTALEKQKQIRPAKLPYGPISAGEDFSIPQGWCKSTIVEMCGLLTGATPDRGRPEYFDGDVPWLVSGDINKGEIFHCDGRITVRSLSESNCKILPTDSVLIALNGQGKTRGMVAILRIPAACNQSLVSINPFRHDCLSPEYLFLNLRSRYEALRELTGGDERRGLNMKLISCLEIAVPPFAEQCRIVSKVDELMALCDRLETARAEREAARDRLAAASLARLSAPDPRTLVDDARFVLNAMPAVTSRPDQIKQLRQTILDLAVRGKLVSQNSDEEPASGLLTRIAAERERLLKAGTIPRQKKSVRDPSRRVKGLPASWEMIALGDCCNMVTSGSRGWAEFYSDSGPGFIRAQNIRFGKLRLDDLAFVQPPSNSEGSRTQVAKDDLLVVITGAGVSNPALLDRDLGEAYVSQHVGLVRPADKNLSRWLLLCLMAPAGGREELVELAYGSGKPGLNLDNIRSLSVPLPPLAEQHRIVAKVDELMAICDRLEASLDSAATTRRRLLEALLAEALAPALSEAA